MKASAIIYGNLAYLQYSRDRRHTKYQKIQFLRICGLYYSTALAWNNPPISDGGATQLRQLGDIRSNPPRLVNEWASDLEATSLTRMKPAQGLILPRSNEPMSALPKTTRLAEFVAKPS